MNEKMTLEEFVHNAVPIVDENFESHPMFSLWEKYMNDATEAHANARKSLREGCDYSAYWNALNAIGCYAAAHATVENERDDRDATALATFANLSAIAGARANYPHLYRRYAHLKPPFSVHINAATCKIKPKLRWIGRKLYCGEILLCEAFHDNPENSQSTFEFHDMVFDQYDRNFQKHWEAESQKGKTIEAVLEEIYTNGFGEIKVEPDACSWKYELGWCDDVFIDSGDERKFLFGNAGNLFLGDYYIGQLNANARNEFCYDPMYFRQQVFMKSDGRLLQDGRLIVPAETNPRDVVEAIVQDVLTLLDVELVPR